MTVGMAIQAALLRAKELENASARRLTIRLATRWGDDLGDGLTIQAGIAAKTPAEMEARMAAQDHGLGIRTIPWAELDARAGELVGLVEALAREAELAILATSTC